MNNCRLCKFYLGAIHDMLDPRKESCLAEVEPFTNHKDELVYDTSMLIDPSEKNSDGNCADFSRIGIFHQFLRMMANIFRE